jgi:hypothetical protein
MTNSQAVAGEFPLEDMLKRVVELRLQLRQLVA